jgi:non-ribosomal peptide synthetase component E (peptide arylation enzyme)
MLEAILMPVFHTRLTPDLVERYTRSGHWNSTTFYEILHQRAAAHPDREAIIDHRQRVTYGELCTRVERTAAALQQCGIGPGDVVTIQLPNWAEFAYVFFACERLGAVANQIGPDFRSREVEYILRFSESRAFVCPETFRGFEYVPMIRALRPHLPDLQTVCVFGSPGAPDTVSLDEMLSSPSPLPLLVPQPLGANDVMRMAFTSGTTGNPKGVTHSCNTTLAACRILNDAMQVGEHEVFLIYLPLGLNWGYLTLLQALLVGARAVLLERFSARAALELMERERVTFIPSAPASLIAMLNEPDLGRFDLRGAPRRAHGWSLLSGRHLARLPGPDARALDRALRHA